MVLGNRIDSYVWLLFYNLREKNFLDKSFRNSLGTHQRMGSIQNNAALTMTGTIRKTSKERLNQEFGSMSLQYRRWFRKISLFYKIMKNEAPFYLFSLIQKSWIKYSTRLFSNIPRTNINRNFLKNNQFFSAVIE